MTSLRRTLLLMQALADENKFSSPYIVGGFVRDVFLKNFDNVKDVDVTCGDKTTIPLAQKLLSVLEDSTLTMYSDGHAKLIYNNIKLDFSNNFMISKIDRRLFAMGVNNPTNMVREIYSRDFTINTLLMPMDLSNVIDITKRAKSDLQNKIIDTCLEPKITLGEDPKRIIRVVYLAAKLGFNPSERVANWIINNPNSINDTTELYLKKKLNKALLANKDITLNLLNKLNLSSVIPLTKQLITSYGK